MPKLSFNSDLHTHTRLSPCGNRDTTAQTYLELCAEAGVDTIGFSNHYWETSIPGADYWYTDNCLGLENILKIRDELDVSYGIRTLIGAEVDYDGRLGITKESAANLDYVLVSTSHLDNDFVIEGMKSDTVDDIRLVLMERFLMAVADASELPVPASMGHPFHPLGYFHMEDEVIAGITDKMFLECFTFAAKRGVGIEVHLPTLGHPDSINPNAARMIRLAIQAGCRFTIGSDEHNPRPTYIQKSRNIHKIAEKIGITPDMMMDI